MRRHPLGIARFDVDLLVRLREGRGWSLRELSRRTGLSNPYLCQLENKAVLTPSFDAAVAIAEAFDLKLTVFVRRAAVTKGSRP